MPRWLLPLVAVLALCGRTVTAFAAAGWVGKLTCCCPDPKTCKCHDHCKDGNPHDELKRCSVDAKLVAPDTTVTPVPEVADVATASVAVPLAPIAVRVLLSTLPVPPEPPPI